MAGVTTTQPVPDLETLIERSADATAARLAVRRLVEASPELLEVLRAEPMLRAGVVAIACASRSLTSGLIANSDLLTPLLDADDLAREDGVEALQRSWDTEPQRDDVDPALRRWKQRRLLRIAARDLLGLADLPAVGRELAALAEVCLGAALAAANPEVPIAIIGMGKLGGRELNYASDVDVIFVHDGDREAAERALRKLLSTMTTQTADGIVFRTDTNLRPEGRSGALSRTLESYAAYHAGWGQTWERQALIKARPVAGDPALGAAFTELIEPLVWPEILDPGAVVEIRAMKARSEASVAREGTAGRELKRGPGGIRDIEFAVQLLQLVHGRHDDAVRSPSTIDALTALAADGYIASSDADRLTDAYCFLRTVEHRLQLYDEQQTHELPTDKDTLVRLARVLGYRDTPSMSALEGFEQDHRGHQATVRSIHERLFFAPLLDSLAGVGSLSTEAIEERLRAFGYRDLERTRAAVLELSVGMNRRSQLMRQLLPLILEWLSDTPDPDLGLLQLRLLAAGNTRSEVLATAFRDAPGAAERTCRVLGSSRVIGDALRRQPDFVETLGDDQALASAKTRDELVAGALDTLTWRGTDEQRREGLRRFKRRELLRIGARDLLDFAAVDVVQEELTWLAEACLEAALQSLEAPLPFAVVGMGRLGGAELSYASDVDVMFVYEGSSPDDFNVAESLAERLIGEIGATTTEGTTFRIDTRLRPEGNQGALARTIDGLARYYERWSQTWERQALAKARIVAGDPVLGTQFLELARETTYGAPFTDAEVREVRRMKARIERERIPPGEDPQFHLKLGRGSLSDVEFTVQLLQLLHGTEEPAVRVSSTLGALDALRRRGFVDVDDADALEASFRFCARARNANFLQTGRTRDSLPTDRLEIERLGRLLGYVHQPHTALRDDYRRVTRRARRVVDRVFYGLDTR